MTAYSFSGVQVTSSGSTVTAVAASTFQLSTTDTFFFRYTMDAPVANGFSSITMTPPFGAIIRAALGSARIDLNTTASVAEYSWGSNKKTMMLMIENGVTGVKHYFAIGGADLPAFGTVSAYTAFMAGVTARTSIITNTSNPFRPGASFAVEDIAALSTTTENDSITGNAAFDNWSVRQLQTGAGNDSVTGLAGVDKIDAGIGSDSVNGLGGNDSIIGNAGNDTLIGGTGDDTLSGSSGYDSLTGDDGADRLIGGANHDTLNGGVGNDRLDGEDGYDVLIGGAGVDTLNGGLGNDNIDGGTENDAITGGAGNDVLIGGAGNDTIGGGEGTDMITGGAGNDLLTGGGAADVFIFANGHGADRISDFNNDIDTLQLGANLGLSSAAQALTFATQAGSNVVFNFGDGDTIILLNITKAALLDDITIL